jgi:N-acetylglutamate synthase-like GNAT family acetyltransferase
VSSAPAGVTIHPAEARHAEPIRALIERVDINTRGLDWRHFLVAEDAAGSLVGCGQVKAHPGGVRELASIAVVPEQRRRGLARALIEALLAQHLGPLYLMSESGLEAFYAQFGFRRIDETEMPTYFRRMIKLPGFVELFTKDNLQVIVMTNAPTDRLIK